jgi:hypothetical protein
MVNVRLDESPIVAEQRAVTRTRIVKPAKIVFQSTIEQCVLRNITARGACIETDGGSDGQVGAHFALTLDNHQSFRRCRVIWQQAQLMGVQFWGVDSLST